MSFLRFLRQPTRLRSCRAKERWLTSELASDYYPTGPGNFVSTMKPFHDKYCNENTKFAIGEIGLNNAANLNTRVQFLQEMTSASTASQMPHYVATAWFNYFKDYQFKIANVQGDSQTAAYLA